MVTASSTEMVPACEICTAEDMVAREFREQKAMFFEDSLASGRHRRRWAVRRGTIGSGETANQVLHKVDGVCEKHVRVHWNGKNDEYLVVDQNSSTGTYLVLSCWRACREAVKLDKGDVFYLAKVNAKQSRRSAMSLVGKGGVTKDTIDFANYVKFQVKDIYPKPKLRTTTQNTKSPTEKGASKFTTRRDSESVVRSSLLSQKFKDTNFLAVKEAYHQARDGFDTTPGALATKADFERIAAEKPGRTVVLSSVEHENGLQTKLNRNTLGGSSLFEEDVLLDAAVCDNVLGNEHLAELAKQTNESSLTIATALHQAPSDASSSPEQEQEQQRKSSDSADSFEPNVGAASLESHIELEQLSGSHKGKCYLFDVHDVTIGSHKANWIRIPDVSPFHVRIERDHDNNFWLRDTSVGHQCGTLLQLRKSRPMPIEAGDIYRFGLHAEFRVCLAADNPGTMVEHWENLALRVTKVRRTMRYRQLAGPSGYLYEPSYFIMSSAEEMTIGRKVQECDVAVKDYEMPAFAAVINHYDNRYFLTPFAESKKKGIYVQLSRRNANERLAYAGGTMQKMGKIHLLQKGDTFRVGRSQFNVVLKKTEDEVSWHVRHSTAREAVAQMHLFKSLKPSEIDELAAAACLLKFEKGDVVIRQGNPVNGLFIVAEGTAEVFHEHTARKTVSTVTERSLLGEMAFFSGLAASASIRAAGDMSVYFISHNVAKMIINPINYESMRIVVEHRIMQAHVHDLRNVPSLKSLDANMLYALSRRMFRVTLDRGETLFEKGEHHQTMYIVGTGTLYLTYDDLPKPLGVKPLSKRKEFIPVYGGGNVLGNIFSTADAGEAKFTAPFSATAEQPCLLYGLRLADMIDVQAMSPEEIEAEAKSMRDGVNDILLRQDRRYASATQTGTHFTDTGGSVVGSTNDLGASAAVSKGGYKMGGVKVTPAEQHLHGTSMFESRRASRMIGGGMSRSASVSIDEGEEGAAFARIQSRLSHDSEDARSDGSGASEFTDYISMSEDEGDDSDLDDPAEIEELTKLLFSRQTELEASLANKSAADIEAGLAELPFYLVLRCTSGPQKRQVFILTETLTIIGRRSMTRKVEDKIPGHHFVATNDRTVSRLNSMIEFRNNDFYISDLQSKYGTHLKLGTGADYKLELGDVISCSQHEFTVLGQVDLQPNYASSSCCTLM